MEISKANGEMSEETRKIQLTGRSTYIVSLPKRWVTDMNLKAGSQLAILKLNDSSLVLTPKELVKPIKLGEATIIVSENEDPNTLMRKVVALYLVGYNLIRIKTREQRITSANRNFIKDMTRRKLVGTEIITDALNEMTLQVLISYPELSVDSALRRMCLIASSMHEDAIQALRHLNQELAKEVIALDDEVDRFSFYVIRQLKAAVQNEGALKEIGLTNPRDCLGYRVIAKSVERIADHAVKIAENVTSMRHQIDSTVYREVSAMSSFARSVLDDSIKSLYGKDYKLADSVVTKSKRVASMENEAMKVISKGIKAEDSSNMRMILESIRRTTEYASDIAEIVLNLNISQMITT